jgi:hypothetical protein
LCISAKKVTKIEDCTLLKQLDELTKERMDIVCDNFKPGVPLNIDVSVTDPRQLKYTGSEYPIPPGRAALDRETEKCMKYGGNDRWALHLRLLLLNLLVAGALQLVRFLRL